MISCTTFLHLVTGVRADPNYSYSYDIICMYVRIVTFDSSLKYVFHFFSRYVGTWYQVVGMVVGTVFFSVSITCGAKHAGRIYFDTKRKRENSCVWPFEVRVILLSDRSRA